MTQPAQYDLREHPWVPARSITGAAEHVGLTDLLLRAHDLADLSIPIPPAAAGMWRVLYAITARVTGLDRPSDDWHDRRAATLARGSFDPDAVCRYFDQYPGRFNLFDATRPWMQDPRLASQMPKSSGVNKLLMSRSSGQNHTWFDHSADDDQRPVPSALAALHLLVWHYYGAAGRCATRVVGTTTAGVMAAGPLRRTLSFHPVGRTLFESLVVGLPRPDEDVDPAADLCPWEAATLPDPLGSPPHPAGPRSTLTGRSQHGLLLVPDGDGSHAVDAYVTWGWTRKADPAEDPYLVYQRTKDDRWYARQADADRAVWRSIDALLDLSDTPEARTRQPAVFRDASHLPGPVLADLRVTAYGFDQDGQTRDRAWFTATTPPVLGALHDGTDVAEWAAEVRDAAENIGRRLAWVVHQLWLTSGADPKSTAPWAQRAAAEYWAAAEPLFWQLIGEGRDAGRNPIGVFRRAAGTAYDTATRPATSMRFHAARERYRVMVSRPWDASRSAGYEARLDYLQRYVDWIEQVCDTAPQIRSALRQSRGRPPEKVNPRIHRIISPFLQEGRTYATERAFYTVAAAIGGRPRQARDLRRATLPDPEEVAASGEPVVRRERVNLGVTYARAVPKHMTSTAASNQIEALAGKSLDGIHRALPRAIGSLGSYQAAVDWVTLLDDLTRYEYHRDAVTSHWLQAFYSGRTDKPTADTGTDTGTDDTDGAAQS